MALKFRYAALLACAAAALCAPPLRAAEPPSLCAAPDGAPEPRSRIVCPGEYAGHLQGLATDGKAIYWSFSKDLVKTGFDGRLLAHATIPHHGGDPCWSNGRLYVPVCGSGFNRKPKPGVVPQNFVYVFDAGLRLLETHHIPETEYGAGGMAEKDGRFFIVGGRPADTPGNTVYEYDENFKLIRRHELDFDSRKGIQTINHAFKKWYFGCYGTGGLTVETDEDFRVLRKVRPGTPFGMIALAEGTALVGRASPTDKKKLRSAEIEVARFTAAKPGKK